MSDDWPTDIDSYSPVALIGEGASSKVYKAYVPSKNEYVAVKVMNLEATNSSMNRIAHELSTVQRFKHPNIVSQYCCFSHEHNAFFVMPLLSGSSHLIMSKLYPQTGLDEVLLATILKYALLGLECLHSNSLIHRDIKAGNILISATGEVKLADFGVAASLLEHGMQRKTRSTFVGTPCWMAPEVADRNAGYDTKVDIWSLGMTALELAEGRVPRFGEPAMQVLTTILNGKPPEAKTCGGETASRSFRDFVAACLKKQPSERPTASELLEFRFIRSMAKDATYLQKHLLSQFTKYLNIHPYQPARKDVWFSRREMPHPSQIFNFGDDDDHSKEKKLELEDYTLKADTETSTELIVPVFAIEDVHDDEVDTLEADESTQLKNEIDVEIEKNTLLISMQQNLNIVEKLIAENIALKEEILNLKKQLNNQ
eukprot:TRINITY_DN11746_c0_g1_i1.p1 TRINITY_DN11746_c0_g1~~TRINITY_DN11746_c0_g1_i1.p1  ORF type:complete len:427 (-),score=120.99 TRINITY_DN11746_c0_g1_i1:19-1299(-)